MKKPEGAISGFIEKYAVPFSLMGLAMAAGNEARKCNARNEDRTPVPEAIRSLDSLPSSQISSLPLLSQSEKPVPAQPQEEFSQREIEEMKQNQILAKIIKEGLEKFKPGVADIMRPEGATFKSENYWQNLSDQTPTKSKLSDLRLIKESSVLNSSPDDVNSVTHSISLLVNSDQYLKQYPEYAHVIGKIYPNGTKLNIVIQPGFISFKNMTLLEDKNPYLRMLTSNEAAQLGEAFLPKDSSYESGVDATGYLFLRKRQ